MTVYPDHSPNHSQASSPHASDIAAPAIEFCGAAVSYGGEPVVRDIDLSIEQGTLHVLLGESGSGKTTLLRTMAGFEPLCAGTLKLAGRVVDDGAGRMAAPEKRGVGVVFQDYALFPHLDVAGNLAFGQGRRDNAAIDRLLDAVGLSGYGSRAVSSLSGGEQQRVALARALAQAPKTILFDEPFSNLNRELRRELRRETVSLMRELGTTAVFVTHSREEAFAIADTLSVLDRGNLLATGSPLELYANPRSLEVARSLGDCTLVHGERHDDMLSCVLGEVAVRGAGKAVIVRPHDVVLGVGKCSVEVTHVELCGPHSRLTLKCGDVELIAFADNGQHAVGDRTLVQVASDELPAVES